MDTTLTYIKMRVAAIPDLGMGDEKWALCSPWFMDGTDNVWVAPNGNYYCKNDDVIGCQLERQDQLQKMVNKFPKALFAFDDWVWALDEHGIPYGIAQPLRQFSSMEQLWLAFVMKEKYKKTWNGEDWA